MSSHPVAKCAFDLTRRGSHSLADEEVVGRGVVKFEAVIGSEQTFTHACVRRTAFDCVRLIVIRCGSLILSENAPRSLNRDHSPKTCSKPLLGSRTCPHMDS